MKTFYGYHVVTERPMYLGQNIVFSGKHFSGVYQRVMERRAVVEDIYANPSKYEKIDLEYPTVVALRELALEEVRKEKYMDYPSRLACLYVSETLQEAEQWAAYFMSLGRPTFQIVKLKIEGSRFVGDANKCFYATVRKAENLEMAEKYWKNEDNLSDEPSIKEILVSGAMEVVEIVKEFENVSSNQEL